MKLERFMRLGIGLSAFCFIIAAQASGPLWTFTPDTNFPPKLSVSSTGTATVKYKITNKSSKPITRNLVILRMDGVRQTGSCIVGPKGSSNPTCILTLAITGNALPASGVSGGPDLCQSNPDGSPNPNQCYRPSQADSLAITVVQGRPILSANTANLALSITGLTLNGLPSGKRRVITIINTGDAAATNLRINYPAWPSGTSVDLTAASACINGRTLPVGGSCTITVVPGSTASSGNNNAACTTGIAPRASIISVTANNANQTSTNVLILGYGCIYQGGFIYAMTETPNTSKSIGGSVVTQVDQSPRFPNGVLWSSNGAGGTVGFVSFDMIPGIGNASTPGFSVPSYSDSQTLFNSNYSNTATFPFPPQSSFAACNGGTNGACNSRNILTLYNTYITNYDSGMAPPYMLSPGPTNPLFYAAGVCTQSISGYSDWYLPAICEMGPDAVCTPGTQNIVDNLPALIGDPAVNPDTSCALLANCLSGFYWSSTEYFILPEFTVWGERFSNLGSFATANGKQIQLGVRCTRTLTS